MGANVFICTAKNTNAKNAFDYLVERARHEYGCNGYTGTIAEKQRDGFVMFTHRDQYMTTDAARKLINEVLDSKSTHRLAKSVDDKWGPAGCIALSKTEFVFFGWAAS